MRTDEFFSRKELLFWDHMSLIYRWEGSVCCWLRVGVSVREMRLDEDG